MQERRTDQTTGRTRDPPPMVGRRGAGGGRSDPRVARPPTPAHSTAGSATTPNLPRGPHAEARPVVHRHHAARREQHAAPQRAPAQASYNGSWFRLSVRRQERGSGERCVTNAFSTHRPAHEGLVIRSWQLRPAPRSSRRRTTPVPQVPVHPVDRCFRRGLTPPARAVRAVRGQSAAMMFDVGAGDVLTAGVVQHVQREDFGRGARVEHAFSARHSVIRRRRCVRDPRESQRKLDDDHVAVRNRRPPF